MDAKTLVEILDRMPPTTSILIRGDHGVGKSEIVRQLADRSGKTLIDFRASTASEGDVLGFPNLELTKTTGRACFALPSWYIRATEEPCILFLDEINRGLIGVQNSLFQIVLDREFGSGPDGLPIRLHPETQVVAAANVGSNYQVSDMDPALLDRFWAVDFKPTPSDWLAWAGTAGISPVIIDFIRQHPDHLRPVREVEPGKVTPSGRAWAMLDKSLKAMGLGELQEQAGAPDRLLYHVAIGFVGSEASASFVDFVKSLDRQFTAEDVLNNWTKTKAKIVDLPHEKKLALIEKVKAHCSSNSWDGKQAKNLKSFFDTLTGELQYQLHQSVMDTAQYSNLKLFHQLVQARILELVQMAQNAGGGKK